MLLSGKVYRTGRDSRLLADDASNQSRRKQGQGVLALLSHHKDVEVAALGGRAAGGVVPGAPGLPEPPQSLELPCRGRGFARPLIHWGPRLPGPLEHLQRQQTHWRSGK